MNALECGLWLVSLEAQSRQVLGRCMMSKVRTPLNNKSRRHLKQTRYALSTFNYRLLLSRSTWQHITGSSAHCCHHSTQQGSPGSRQAAWPSCSAVCSSCNFLIHLPTTLHFLVQFHARFFPHHLLLVHWLNFDDAAVRLLVAQLRDGIGEGKAAVNGSLLDVLHGTPVLLETLGLASTVDPSSA